MFSGIPLLKLYDAMARHAAESQAVSAENIAHAGQPGYRAMQVESFSDFISRTGLSADPENDAQIRRIPTADMIAPNGSSVSLEAELMRSVSSKSMDLLRTALGKRY
jgi:flagellar basal-body rod protein FlgB